MVPDGGVALLSLRLPADLTIDAKSRPTGEFEGTPIPFFPRKETPGLWQALVGIPHAHAPGEVEVTVRAAGAQGRSTFQVIDGQYLSEVLKVQERKVNPRPSDLKRIKKEGAAIREAYQTLTTDQLWDAAMKFPIDSPMTSAYGTKRVYNGQLKSFHSGLDLRAPIGTPIQAAAGGIVRLSQNLFFTGNTVILDHGYGLMTLYAHLSRRKVKVGQRVRAGTLLGLSGQTGRVNGPHLHWMAIVHSTKVNPLEVMKVLR